MTQADCVLSTPPTNTPVDTTRRRFLTVAATGSIVGASSLAFAAAAPNDVPQAVTVTLAPATAGPATLQDPIYAAIETYKKHSAEHQAAIDELDRLETTAPDFKDWGVTEGPCHDEFTSFDAVLSVVATTLPGLLAKLAFLQNIAEDDAWMLDDREGAARRLIESFSASLANVSAVLS